METLVTIVIVYLFFRHAVKRWKKHNGAAPADIIAALSGDLLRSKKPATKTTSNTQPAQPPRHSMPSAKTQGTAHATSKPHASEMPNKKKEVQFREL